MENATDIVQKLDENSSSYEEKKELVERLKQLASENKGVLYLANLNKLFHTLEQLLVQEQEESSDAELSLEIMKLLTVLAANSDPETEIFLTKFLQPVIACLGTSNKTLKKSIMVYISHYITTTLNYEAVFSNANRYGLESSDWKIRSAALEAIDVWWTCCATINEKIGIENNAESKKLIQNIIMRLKDSSGIVQKGAQNILVSMTVTLPNVMHNIVNKMSPHFQSIYNDLMVQEQIEHRQFPIAEIELADNLLGEEIKQVGVEGKNHNENGENEWPEMDGLVFGIFPPNLIKDLGATSNWKERGEAIEEINDILNIQENVDKLDKYISSFFKFVVRLLNDTNYKVSVATLQIISKLIYLLIFQIVKLLTGKKKTIGNKANLHIVVPGIVDKLGDNKINIRQLAQESLRVLKQLMKPTTLFGMLIPFLNNPNWHIREEILLFIIGAFLTYSKEKQSGSTNPSLVLEELDYAQMVNGIAKLLDDEKPKVVQIVYETIATIAHIGDRTKV